MTQRTAGPAPTPAEIGRQFLPGLAVTSVRRRKVTEYNIACWPLPGEAAGATAARVARLLQQLGVRVLKHDVFGATRLRSEVLSPFASVQGGLSWPVTWAEGASCTNGPLAGMHLLAIAGSPVEPVFLNGRHVGQMVDTGQARHCLLGNLNPADPAHPPADQAREAFEQIEAAVAQAGMKMTDVVRTWLFLNDILSWYTPLNEVRRRFFEERDLFSNLLPASTGVGASNMARTAVTAAAWALQDTCGAVTTREVHSPLQCPAPNYGSCFSRAVEIAAPTHRRLLISGTASINPDGTTAHVGKLDEQIDLTMEVIESILRSRGFWFSDATRATAYFRLPEDAPGLEAWCNRKGVYLPLVVTNATVCRDDLLFELELEAVRVPTVEK